MTNHPACQSPLFGTSCCPSVDIDDATAGMREEMTGIMGVSPGVCSSPSDGRSLRAFFLDSDGHYNFGDCSSSVVGLGPARSNYHISLIGRDKTSN